MKFSQNPMNLGPKYPQNFIKIGAFLRYRDTNQKVGQARTRTYTYWDEHTER